MGVILRFVFGAVTLASYHSRFLLMLVVVGALTGAIVFHGTPFKLGFIELPWFTVVTALLFVAISVPIKWRRLTIDRPYFHRKGMGAVSIPMAAAIIVFTTMVEGALLVFATLFSLPVDKGPEFNWTLYLLAATGAISFLILKALDERGWKSARWSYFRLPTLMGLLFATFVHVVSTASMVVTPEMNSNGDRQKTRLFEAPTEPEALQVLTHFFGESFLSQFKNLVKDQRSVADNAQTAVKTITESIPNLCSTLSIADDESKRRFPNGEDLGSSELEDAKKLLKEVCNNKLIANKDAWIVKDWRRANAKSCDSVQSLTRSIESIRNINLDIWMNLRCGSALGTETKDYCKNLKDRNDTEKFQENSGDWKELRSCDPSLSVQFSAASSKLDKIYGRLDAISQNNDGVANYKDFGLLKAYSILDGFVQAKIVDAIGRAYINAGSGQEKSANDTQGELAGSLTGYLCDEKESKESKESSEDSKRKKWCAQESAERALASVLFSPYILQGFVLSVYVTALLLAFRRRDDGDPDLGVSRSSRIDRTAARGGPVRDASAAAGSLVGLRPRASKAASSRLPRREALNLGLFDWLDLDQLPSVIDPSIGEIAIAEPITVSEPLTVAETDSFEGYFDRPVDLGDHRIPFPDPRKFTDEQDKLHAALKKYIAAAAESATEGASLTDDWCKIFGTPLKFLLSKCPDSINLHDELPSVLRNDLATEFRTYERAYFVSRDPQAVVGAVNKYERFDLVSGGGAKITGDLSSIKRLNDDQLCFLIALASAAAIGAVFSGPQRR